jgi:HEAT repeat protein
MPTTDIPFETLIADLHGSDWTKRCDAARMLGQSKDPRAVDALLPDLKDPDWKVRRNAAQALGALKSPKALVPLTEALQDRVATVRERAAVGLGRIKDPQSIPVLLDAFLRKDKLHVGSAALQALRKYGRKAAPQLVEAFKQNPNPYLIDLLVVAKAEGLGDLLLPHITSTDMFMRDRVIQVLGASGDAQAADTLLAHLPQSDMMTQIAIVQALGHLKATQALPTLLDMFQSDDLYGQHTMLYRAVTDAVQHMSGVKAMIEGAFPTSGGFNLNMGGATMGLAEGMSILNNKQVADLNAMLANMETQVREMGAQLNLPPDAVEKIAGQTWGYGAMFADARDAKTERVKVLIDLLKAESPLVRLASALSLVWYTDPQALTPLEHAALDPDPDVRRMASWAHRSLQKTIGYIKDNE